MLCIVLQQNVEKSRRQHRDPAILPACVFPLLSWFFFSCILFKHSLPKPQNQQSLKCKAERKIAGALVLNAILFSFARDKTVRREATCTTAHLPERQGLWECLLARSDSTSIQTLSQGLFLQFLMANVLLKVKRRLRIITLPWKWESKQKDQPDMIA